MSQMSHNESKRQPGAVPETKAPRHRAWMVGGCCGSDVRKVWRTLMLDNHVPESGAGQLSSQHSLFRPS